MTALLAVSLRTLRSFRRKDRSSAPWADAEGRLRVRCWYCEKQIAYEGFDPCAVILVTNWAEERRQREQQFFAHAKCFRESGSGTDLYIFEDDFPTRT